MATCSALPPSSPTLKPNSTRSGKRSSTSAGKIRKSCRLKPGLFFNMTGAAVSHAALGDYGAHGYHLIVTLTSAGLALASWALRPQSRTLGVLFPANDIYPSHS